MATNPSTAFSYTNKDFQTLYTELLDTAKKLSAKWDPSISNESDPGVVLLKLNAIIGDKNNYNIDRNILEYFPETASQEINIRNIYKQLGYNMPWYRSGSGEISLQWKGTTSSASVTLPQFTSFSNDDYTIVYTLKENTVLPLDGSTIEAEVIGGIATQLQVAGAYTLYTSNLNSKNRLYFSDYQVAENGIFIFSYRNGVLQNDYTEWTRVDNLLLEPLGSKVYEFGIDSDYNMPYLEFPEDIDSLIPEGMEIWYTISNGEAENIPAFVLTKPLLSEMTLTDSNGDTRSISSDTLYVINYSSIINNKDAETIEQAANSYKKTLGTFSTLVTLRDYINAIYNSGLISNGTVSDRTTDLQDSSRVVTTEGTETVFKTVTNDMAPFDLKLYVLQYVGTPSTYADYNTGFTLVSREAPFALTSYLENEKCIQHDFIELQKNKICFLKNCYKISTTIIPTQTLNSEQTNNLRSVIQNALFEKLNSNAVDFGEEVGFRKVFEVIEESSPFIKSVSLDSIVYNTYATYFDENDVQKEIVVSNEHPYVEGYAYANGSTVQFFSDEEHTKAVQGAVNSQYLDISTGNIYSYASGTYSLYSSKRNEFRKEIYTQCVLSGCSSLFDFQEDFDYTVLHKFLQSTKTKDVSTRSVIELSTNESYTVHPNEVIQFYAPAYSDVTSYSTYVKYVFYSPSNTAEELETPKEITPDSIYTLGEGEYIVFLWKNSEEDLRYTYHKYAAGTILYSNVTLTQDATAQVYTNGLSDNIEGKIIDTAANNFFAGYQDNVLTSNSSVTIKSALKDTLNNSVNQCYFITNDRVVGSDNVERSVLFGEPSIRGIYDTWDSTDTKDDFTIDVGKFYTATNGGNSVMNIQFDADENKWIYEGTKTSLSALGITYSKKYGATDYYTYEVPTVSTSSSTMSVSIEDDDVSQAVTQLHLQSEYVVFEYDENGNFNLVAPSSLESHNYTPSDFGITGGTTNWVSDSYFCVWLDTNSIAHTSKCTYVQGAVTPTDWGSSSPQVITDFDKCYEKMLPLQRVRTYTYSSHTSSWTPTIVNTGISRNGDPSDGDTITLRLESQNIYVSFDTASSDEHLFISGEYFLYKDGTQLKICGPGTLIKRTATNENTYPQPWQCVVKSAEDILEYGLNAFTKNDWLQFYKNNYTITISEVQFLNLLEGDTLQLSSSDSKLIVDDKNSSTISATISDYSSQEPPYSIDVTTAREFLASEGYPDGTYSCTPSVDGISTTSRINVPTGSTYAGTVTSIDGQKLYDMLTYTGEVTFSSRMVENTCYWEASQGTSELFTTTTLANDYGIVISPEPSDDQVEIVVGIAIISNSKFDVTCEEIDGTVWDFHLTVLASALGIEDTTEEFSDYALITINYGSRFTNGIDISYIVSGETTSQNLPTAPVEDSYRARTILNLIIGPTQPQTLYPNQFVTLTPEDGSSDVVIHDKDEVVTVVSDVNLSIDGGEDVDVTLIDSIGDIDYPIISSYKFGNNEYGSNLIVNGNTFIFTVAPGEIVEQSTDVTPKSSTYHFNFAYPEGNYILPLYNPFDWSAESDGHVEVFLDHEPTLDTQSLKFETISETNRDGHDIAFNKLIENEDSIEFTYDNGWKVDNEEVNLSDYGLEEADSSRATTTLQFGDTSPVISSSSSVTVSDSTFISKVGQNNFANYDFIHDNGWKLDGIPVSLSDYGISVTQGFEGNFTIQYMPHQLFEIDNTQKYNFKGTGYHYILLPVMKNIEAIGGSDMVSTQHTIRFYFRNPHTSTYTSTLYGSDRIVNPENCGEILSEASDIKTSLSGQDIKFKYNYRPGENKIEDPLASTSFLNKNHIYNKFTICKATTPFVIQIVK